MVDKKKLAKEFVLFLLALGLVVWLVPKVLLSSEDKTSQYVACSNNEGLKDFSHFSNEVKCNDGSNQLWK
jgi:hypothetical protein